MRNRIGLFLPATVLAGALHLSAADLPEDLRQMRDYFNNPPALKNITYVVTNYSVPFIFSNREEFREAVETHGLNPTKPTVSYRVYSYDSELPGILCRQFPPKLFNSILRDYTILTNDQVLHEHISLAEYYSPVYRFTGRSKNTWWKAVPELKVGLYFNVLEDSANGVFYDDNKKNHTFLWDLHGDSTLPLHFGYGLFEPGTWKIKAKNSDNSFEWSGTSTTAGIISGSIWPTNNQWIMEGTGAPPGRRLTTRIEWDGEARMPREFFTVHPEHHEGIHNSLTRINTLVNWHEDYPEAFHYSYHTNSGIKYGNLIQQIALDGSRTTNFDELAENRVKAKNAMASRVRFYRFLLFVTTVGVIGFLLYRRAQLQKQKNRAQINY